MDPVYKNSLEMLLLQQDCIFFFWNLVKMLLLVLWAFFSRLLYKSLETLNSQVLSPDNEFWNSDQQKAIQLEWHLSKLPQKNKKCSVSVSHSLVAGNVGRLLKGVSSQ